MPNLIHLSSFSGEKPALYAPFYFKDAYRSTFNSNSWTFNIAETYPHVGYVHCDDVPEFISEGSEFWIETRRWVERHCAGDVIVKYEGMSYQWWWNKDAKNEWDREYTTVRHGYWHFYFEDNNDFHMFILKHGNWVKLGKLEHHPDYGKDVLEQKELYGKGA